MRRFKGASWPSAYRLVGASSLYASAYFLPYSGENVYFLPSGGLFHMLVLPSLFAVAVLSIGAWIGLAAARRWLSPRLAMFLQIVFVAALALIAMKGCMTLVGYDWEDRLPQGKDLLTAQRYFKVLVFLAVLTVIFFARSALRPLYRLLSSVGFAFALVAAVRLWLIVGDHSSPTVTAPRDPQPVASTANPAVGSSQRRVVWVIFDETDFMRAFHGEGEEHVELKNFEALARSAVFATNASSPASATMYSIPALLTGTELGGKGIRIRGRALTIETADGNSVPFDESASIFGTNAHEGRSSSILGFYHPYCRLFPVARCDSFAWPDIGTLSSALWSNVPKTAGRWLNHPDPWQEITKNTLRLLPEYLQRRDALTFVHLNFPHPPATFADNYLHLSRSGDPLVEYSHNLLFADKILGDIIGELEKQASTHEVLLVVSSDHWLRNMWFDVGVPDSSRPVPFIVWRVGESKGVVVSKPVNTGRTSVMILDYLDGRISTQGEVAEWWSRQSYYPSFVIPEG